VLFFRIPKAKRGLSQPPPPFGVLLLQKEERINILIIYNFPSFSRRGVMPEGS
jgi:hypothetical protein